LFLSKFFNQNIILQIKPALFNARRALSKPAFVSLVKEIVLQLNAYAEWGNLMTISIFCASLANFLALSAIRQLQPARIV
jgi:hypothetical protein